METAVSTKIVEEIINYAKDAVNTPTDSSRIATEFINDNDGCYSLLPTLEELDEEMERHVQQHEDYDDGYRQAMKHILDIIQEHLK